MSTTTVRPRVIDDQPYRRGVSQAIAFARDWINKCETIDEAKELFAKAEKEALALRNSRKEHPELLNELSRRMRRTRS